MNRKQKRLKEARLRKGLSRKRVAELVPCSVHTLRHWEIDTEPRTISQAQRVCDIVGIDLMYYHTGEIYSKLTHEEGLLLSWYRSLSKEQKEGVRALIDRRV